MDNSHREITRNENCTQHILEENGDEESKRVEEKSEFGIIKLDFSSNPKIGLDGIMNLSFLLYNNSVLRELRLANMRMGIEGVTALVDIISSKHANLHSLEVLDVGYNRLKNHGVAFLCRALRTHLPGLDKIHLGGNGISDYQSFSLLLEKQLDRNMYDLPPDSPQFLPQIERQVLDISSNPIDDSCIKNVAEALDGNRRLKHLDLRCNTTMTQAGWNRLRSLILNCQSLDALEHSNHTLISFGCDKAEVPMRYSSKHAMMQVLKFNADDNLSIGAKKKNKLFHGLYGPDVGVRWIPFALSMIAKDQLQVQKKENLLDLFYELIRGESILSLFKWSNSSI